MAKRKALYITGGIVVLLAVILTIFIIFNMGSSVVIRDKITASDTSQNILTSDEAEKYGVSPTENYSYGLYTSQIELDNQLTVTMEIITVKHTDESEEIMKVLFDVNPEEIKGYDVKTAVYSQDVVEGDDDSENDVICVGNVTVTDDRGESFSEHISYTDHSVFN